MLEANAEVELTYRLIDDTTGAETSGTLNRAQLDVSDDTA
jgi:hypothetical protein